jgi:hypothetical protein
MSHQARIRGLRMGLMVPKNANPGQEGDSLPVFANLPE